MHRSSLGGRLPPPCCHANWACPFLLKPQSRGRREPGARRIAASDIRKRKHFPCRLREVPAATSSSGHISQEAADSLAHECVPPPVCAKLFFQSHCCYCKLECQHMGCCCPCKKHSHACAFVQSIVVHCFISLIGVYDLISPHVAVTVTLDGHRGQVVRCARGHRDGPLMTFTSAAWSGSIKGTSLKQVCLANACMRPCQAAST